MRILIAEDDPIYCRMLESMLGKWGYDVITCTNGLEACRVLQAENTPRLAILDWIIPGMDGVEICKRVREMMKEPYIYIILLTVMDDKEDIVRGMEAGADDYITKPFHAPELKVRLRAGRRILDMQDELMASRETIRVMATRDPLTGLLNRAAIVDTLRRKIEQARREKGHVGIAMSDIDYFKKVNDTFGHIAGDAVLRETAKRMCSSLRPYDEIGRYGGEEFLIIMPGCDAQNAIRNAERLRLCVEKSAMDTSEGMIPVTMCFGVTAITHGKTEEVNAIIHTADKALYRAKAGGRNRVEFIMELEL